MCARRFYVVYWHAKAGKNIAYICVCACDSTIFMLSYSQGETSGQLQLSSVNKSNSSGAEKKKSSSKRPRTTEKSSGAAGSAAKKAKIAQKSFGAARRNGPSMSKRRAHKPKSTRYRTKKANVSGFSKTVDIKACKLFKRKSICRINFNHADKVSKPYGLVDIAKQLGLLNDAKTILDVGHNKSERLAIAILKATIGDKYTYQYNCDVSWVTNGVPTLYTNEKTKPDVAVYRNSDELVFVVEVQSSPMEYALKSCVMRGEAVLRYYRLFDKSFNKLVHFAVPSLTSSSCIVKVELTFQNLRMQYDLTCYEGIDAGIRAIKEEFNNQIQQIPPISERYSNNFIELTQPEIRQICKCKEGGCEQRNSQNSILTFCQKGDVYKVLYTKDDMLNIMRSCRKLIGPSKPKQIIFPSILDDSQYLMYTYKKVHYSPLTFEEARVCLRGFVSSLMKAVEELHSFGLAHYDVRLPNICFNESYEAVLIDLDFCQSVTEEYSLESCLYWQDPSCTSQFNASPLNYGQKIDYMQVGWLIAYILHHEDDEHDRKWESQPTYITGNEMISTLVRSYCYKPHLLQELELSNTLEDVLRVRK